MNTHFLRLDFDHLQHCHIAAAMICAGHYAPQTLQGLEITRSSEGMSDLFWLWYDAKTIRDEDEMRETFSTIVDCINDRKPRGKN